MSEHADSQNELDATDPRIADPGEECPNCGEEVLGPWCYRCGQNQRSIHRVFFSLVADLLEDVLAWNSRTVQTFWGLLFRPGHLTQEFFAGRRARYLPPIRVYLITSFLFFFLLSLQNVLDRPGAIVVQAGDGEVQVESEAAAEEATRNWIDELKEADVDVNVPWLSAENQLLLKQRLDRQLQKLGQIGEDDPGEIVGAVLDVVPPAIFILLPVFALLLKIFYFSFGFYYIEHLVLAVNNHSFLFSILTIETLLGLLPEGTWGIGEVTGVIFCWIPIYMYLSLKVIFRQGHFATFVNFTLLGISYLILLALVTVAALFVGLLAL